MRKQKVIYLRTNTTLLNEYTKLRKSVRSSIMAIPFKERKPYEIDFLHTCRQIEKHGFKFVPEHYITPLLDELVSIQRDVRKVPPKRS